MSQELNKNCTICRDIGDICVSCEERSALAEPVNDQTMYLVVFDDHDVRPEALIGEAVARRRYKDLSNSWNAHLFVKLDSNSRDDCYAKANYQDPNVARLQAENAALQRKLTKANLSCHDLAHKLADRWGSIQGAQFETIKALRYLNEELQQRVNTADQRIDDLQKDKERLDSLEANFWDVRHHSRPIADTGDHSTSVEIIGHWMDKPHERVIGENYNENLRAAIDQAMTADAYPPARPE